MAARERANVWLFARVCPQMRSQIEVQRKPLATNITLVGLLSRVHKLMSFQFRVVQEFLAAGRHLADVHSLAVRHLVLSVWALVIKDLPALIFLAHVLFRQRLQVKIVILVRRVKVQGLLSCLLVFEGFNIIGKDGLLIFFLHCYLIIRELA